MTTTEQPAGDEVRVFVDSSDNRSRTYEQWDEMQQPIFEAIDAALADVSGWTATEADEGVMYTGPAQIYDLIVAAVAGRCAVYRG